jgi:hypothetical protein
MLATPVRTPLGSQKEYQHGKVSHALFVRYEENSAKAPFITMTSIHDQKHDKEASTEMFLNVFRCNVPADSP